MEIVRHLCKEACEHCGKPVYADEGPCAASPVVRLSPAQWADVYFYARAVSLEEFIGRAQEVFEKGQ